MGDVVDEAFVDDFVMGWVKAVNAHDVEALLDRCTSAVTFKDPAYDQPFVGKPAVAGILRKIFGAFPDLSFQLEGQPLLSLDQTVVAVHVHMTGTMSGPLDPPGFAPTHAPISVPAVEMYSFEDGKVSRIHLLFDMLELGRQIGAAPPLGSRADRLGTLIQRRNAKKMRRRAIA